METTETLAEAASLIPAEEAFASQIAGTRENIPDGALKIHRSKRLRGALSFKGDAYLSLFAAAVAALGEDATRLENLPDAPWFQDFGRCLEALGASFEKLEDHWLVRRGGGGIPTFSAEPRQPPHELAALILAGLGSGLDSGSPRAVELNTLLRLDSVNIPSDVRSLLQSMYLGGELSRKARNFCKPFELRWDDTLAKIPLLFHHLSAGESLELQLRRPGSDLLENLLRQFEIDVKVERDDDKNADELTRRMARQSRVLGKEELLTRVKLPVAKPKAAFMALPGDVGEASVVALVATLLKGSDVMLEGVLLNAGRGGFLKALRRMGADIEVTQRRERFGETVGTMRVRSSALFGKRFDAESLSDLRDEVFLLLLAAAFAEGESVFRDLDYLREGPVDLLKSFIAALKQAGVEIGEFEDGLVIRGREEYDGGNYDSLGHSGLAAAYAVLALKSHGSSSLAGAEALDYRFPGLLARIAGLAAAEKSS